MTDKEVGKLWKAVLQDCGKLDDCDNHGSIVALIRKLVEDRAWQIASIYYRTSEVDDVAKQSCIAAALRDFGISPEEWK